MSFEDEVCEIKSEDGQYIKILRAQTDLTIPPKGNHSWLWDTSEVTNNEEFSTKIYRIKPIKPRKWDYPLHRSVIIHCYCKIKT